MQRRRQNAFVLTPTGRVYHFTAQRHHIISLETPLSLPWLSPAWLSIRRELSRSYRSPPANEPASTPSEASLYLLPPGTQTVSHSRPSIARSPKRDWRGVSGVARAHFSYQRQCRMQPPACGLQQRLQAISACLVSLLPTVALNGPPLLFSFPFIFAQSAARLIPCVIPNLDGLLGLH